jgi:hypothetical protein
MKKLTGILASAALAATTLGMVALPASAASAHEYPSARYTCATHYEYTAARAMPRAHAETTETMTCNVTYTGDVELALYRTVSDGVVFISVGRPRYSTVIDGTAWSLFIDGRGTSHTTMSATEGEPGFVPFSHLPHLQFEAYEI